MLGLTNNSVVMCKDCVFCDKGNIDKDPWWCGNPSAFDTEDGTGVMIENRNNGCLCGYSKKNDSIRGNRAKEIFICLDEETTKT